MPCPNPINLKFVCFHSLLSYNIMNKSYQKTFHYSRRAFLGASASAAFSFTFLPSRVFGANERLQIAGIGVGGKGKSDFDHAAAHGDVVAACDIDSRRLDVALRKHPDAVKFSDYRELINQLGDKIDAITVSTPDHTHAPCCDDGDAQRNSCVCTKTYDTHNLGGQADVDACRKKRDLHSNGKSGNCREWSA